MPYNIRHIDTAGLQKRQYFFDANLWLKILKPAFDLKPRDERYLNFFERFKNHRENPKIILTALVLSEVINRYLREVTYPKFCKKKGVTNPDKSYYKEVYRPSTEFLADYISLCEDIKAYQHFYELADDGLASDVKQKDILTSPPQSLDFNDNYYYQLAKKRNYIIVTDDKDFFVEDVEVITYNTQLIEKAKAAVVPKQGS
jgi:predicted nucleic acid-binding protein